MANAGRILILPKGEYDASLTYEMLDLVSHNGTSWIAKKTVAGIEPSAENSEYWQHMFGVSAQEVQNLRNEVQALRDEVQELKALVQTEA